MGLFSFIKNELIDIIQWENSSDDTMVWKFPKQDNEIKMGAKLTVRESQQAVFLNEGRLADVFQPGLYTLQTQNMPILSKLMGWKYGFQSPFKADVFFVNTKQFIDQKWGTKNAITLDDPRFGLVEMRAFGTFAYRITDAGKFLKEVAGIDKLFTTEEVNGQLRSLVISKFTNALGSGNITIDKVAANMEELSMACQEKLNHDFQEYGLMITSFVVENVSMPDDLKKEIFEYSRLNHIDMQKLTQLKTAQSIQTAAANEGMGGIGVGLGAGMSIGNIVTNAIAGNMTSMQNNAAPPPLPGAIQFFVATNGQQTGPFNMEQLMQMAQSGTLKQESLVWKAGMQQWAEARTVTELSGLLNSAPPPLPL